MTIEADQRMACAYGSHPFVLKRLAHTDLMVCTACGATYHALPWQADYLIAKGAVSSEGVAHLDSTPPWFSEVTE